MNADLNITIPDVVYLVNYLYKFKPAPDPLKTGDVNCNDEIGITDAVYLGNYFFKGSPPTC